MTKAETGDRVRVHYTGRTDQGMEFESSRNREPLEVTLGQGQVIPGFEAALIGMAEGDTKTVTIPEAEAYGPRRPELVHEVPRSDIPPEIELEPGRTLLANTPDGNQLRLEVKAVTDETVTVDANHPLAGENLTFDLEMVDVIKA
ncbi:MAG: peptidylprolyl isomerase [Alphaproteobacteria bacterium]|nr:MAG: peptidylprolyl isomerase [Alphaproteobacteria bacterium]